jgi:hypothetical protein
VIVCLLPLDLLRQFFHPRGAVLAQRGFRDAGQRSQLRQEGG